MRVALLPVVVTALLPLGLAAACHRAGAPSTVAAAEEAAGTAASPLVVTVAPVADRELPVVIEATGSFAADEVSDVAPETSGLVAETPVDVGARVVRGAVIARLSTADAELRLAQARAGLQQAEAMLAQANERHALARANARRYEALARTGDVSQTLHEQAASEGVTTGQAVATADAAVAEARTRVALAEKALADTVIRAPFRGFITSRPVAVGEYVGTSAVIATVMKLDPIRLRLQVPEIEASGLRTGQRVTARIAGLGDRAIDGRVTAINPALEAATRAVIVEASMPNPGGLVRAGMFATATVALGGQRRALFVPRGALLADPNTGSFRVFTIAGGIARLRVVQPAAERSDPVRILSGVDAGDQVATSALEELFDGASVRTGAR